MKTKKCSLIQNTSQSLNNTSSYMAEIKEIIPGSIITQLSFATNANLNSGSNYIVQKTYADNTVCISNLYGENLYLMQSSFIINECVEVKNEWFMKYKPCFYNVSVYFINTAKSGDIIKQLGNEKLPELYLSHSLRNNVAIQVMKADMKKIWVTSVNYIMLKVA